MPRGMSSRYSRTAVRLSRGPTTSTRRGRSMRSTLGTNRRLILTHVVAVGALVASTAMVSAQPQGGSDYFREKNEPGVKTFGIWDVPFANPPKTPFGLYVGSGLNDIKI